MDVKIVISVFISTILVGAIFSSSTFVQFAFSQAEYKEYCGTSPDGKKSLCYMVNSDSGSILVTDCTKDSNGEWKCKITQTAVAEPSLPPGLSDALDTALEESPIDTKGLKTGVLDEPGALSGDESSENGNDTAAKKKGAIGNPEYGDIVDKDLGDQQNEDDEDDGPTINDPQTTTEPKIKEPGKIEIPNLK